MAFLCIANKFRIVVSLSMFLMKWTKKKKMKNAHFMLWIWVLGQINKKHEREKCNELNLMLNVRKTFFEQKLMHNEYENYKISQKTTDINSSRSNSNGS